MLVGFIQLSCVIKNSMIYLHILVADMQLIYFSQDDK